MPFLSFKTREFAWGFRQWSFRFELSAFMIRNPASLFTTSSRDAFNTPVIQITSWRNQTLLQRTFVRVYMETKA
ncbi:hypothetical protein M413DRAFT_449920 [Hebeloma cylindrosporum]|uniref:Uncharacterized protein n=1 Tax=Hebeloma cylindrosporum TaxID=76867 RepID=A0A0C2Y1R4_HEBCY|nr:hypothetical protein M413DRAFT_449920 [Hebeloma cylindrosporum h7]